MLEGKYYIIKPYYAYSVYSPNFFSKSQTIIVKLIKCTKNRCRFQILKSDGFKEELNNIREWYIPHKGGYKEIDLIDVAKYIFKGD